MRQVLSDQLTPKGEPEHPRYRLSAAISRISISQQAVRKDNLATRYLMAMSAKFSLFTYPENKKLISGSFTERSNYDVQRSPYATDVSEETIKKRLARILGNDIALRIAGFLKSYRPAEETAEIQKKEASPEQTEISEENALSAAEHDAEQKDISEEKAQ